MLLIPNKKISWEDFRKRAIDAGVLEDESLE